MHVLKTANISLRLVPRYASETRCNRKRRRADRRVVGTPLNESSIPTAYTPQ
jgi:hypothetical protein